jgi:hypothetical protein
MSNTFYLALPAAGTLVGTTVTAIVYTTLVTTGDIAASVTGTGIELTGNVLGFGTELIAGTIAGNSVRTIANTYGALSRPVISNGSRLGAMGFSLLAGGIAAITTTAVVNSSSYLYSYYKDYKQQTNKEPLQIDYKTEEVGDFTVISSPECNNSQTKSLSPLV